MEKTHVFHVITCEVFKNTCFHVKSCGFSERDHSCPKRSWVKVEPQNYALTSGGLQSLQPAHQPVQGAWELGTVPAISPDKSSWRGIENKGCDCRITCRSVQISQAYFLKSLECGVHEVLIQSIWCWVGHSHPVVHRRSWGCSPSHLLPPSQQLQQNERHCCIGVNGQCSQELNRWPPERERDKEIK